MDGRKERNHGKGHGGVGIRVAEDEAQHEKHGHVVLSPASSSNGATAATRTIVASEYKGSTSSLSPGESLASLAMTFTLKSSSNDDEDGTSSSDEYEEWNKFNEKRGVRNRKKQECPILAETEEEEGFRDDVIGRQHFAGKNYEYNHIDGNNDTLDDDSLDNDRSFDYGRHKYDGDDFINDVDLSFRNSEYDYDSTNPNDTMELIQGVICIPSSTTVPSSLSSSVPLLMAEDDPISHVTSTELSRFLQTRQWNRAMKQLQHMEVEARIEVDIQIPRLGKCRGYPLHLACLYQPNPLVVQRLLDAYPEAVRIAKESTCNQLPLHFACMSSASKDVLQLLLRAYPLGVKCRESYAGFLPLHLACYKNAPLYVIEELISVYPEALRVQDHFGDTPLDIVRNRDKDLASSGLLRMLQQRLSNLNLEKDDLSSVDKKIAPQQGKVHCHEPDRVGGGFDVCLVGVSLKHRSAKRKVKHVPRSLMASRHISTYIMFSVPDGSPPHSWLVRFEFLVAFVSFASI